MQNYTAIGIYSSDLFVIRSVNSKYQTYSVNLVMIVHFSFGPAMEFKLNLFEFSNPHMNSFDFSASTKV